MRREVLKREHWVSAARAVVERGAHVVELVGTKEEEFRSLNISKLV